MNCTNITLSKKSNFQKESRQYNTIHTMLKSTDNKDSHIRDKIITENNRNDQRKIQSTVGSCGDIRRAAVHRKLPWCLRLFLKLQGRYVDVHHNFLYIQYKNYRCKYTHTHIYYLCCAQYLITQKMRRVVMQKRTVNGAW